MHIESQLAMKIPPRPTLLTYQPDVNIPPTWYSVKALITLETDLTIQRGRWVTGNKEAGYILHAYSDPAQSPDVKRLLPTVNQKDANYKLLPCKLSKKDGLQLMKFEGQIEERFVILRQNWEKDLTEEEEDRLIIPPLYARAVMDYTVLRLCTPANLADHKKGITVHATLPFQLDRLLKMMKGKWEWSNLASRADGPPQKAALDPSRPRYDATSSLMAAQQSSKATQSSKKSSKAIKAVKLPASVEGSVTRPINLVSSPAASPVKKRMRIQHDQPAVNLGYEEDKTVPNYELHKMNNPTKRQVGHYIGKMTNANILVDGPGSRNKRWAGSTTSQNKGSSSKEEGGQEKWEQEKDNHSLSAAQVSLIDEQHSKTDKNFVIAIHRSIVNTRDLHCI